MTGVAASGARLELTWSGKDRHLVSPSDASGRPVWVDRDHPAATEVRLTEFTGTHGDLDETANPYADNLLFTGDSLDVLRVLTNTPEFRRVYRGKVKAVYIDPPFNTGQAFEHYDDWMDHSTWLSFMHARLLLIAELLSDEGSVWVHLDDAEAHRMRCLMDEVFGAQNFIADLTVEMNPKGRQLDKFFAGSNDRVLVYAKNRALVTLECGSKDDVNHADFPKTDENGLAFRHLPLRNTNKKFNPQTARTMHFAIHGNPRTGKVAMEPFEGSQAIWPVFGDLTPAVWRWSPPKVIAQADELECREVSGRVGIRADIFQRDYLGENRTKKLKTVWMSADTGSSDEGKRELKALNLNGFDTPKPERLLKRIIEIATAPGDIVLDVFGGSGGTAAVAQKLGRRWATAEIKQATVDGFTRPRLLKVVNGLDGGGVTKVVGWDGGGGFRTVRVAPSMYEVTPYGVMLADWATNGKFSRAVAAQLGFDWHPEGPFCGRSGRMRLAVFDGAVGPEEVHHTVGALADTERVTLVAKAVLPGAEQTLSEASSGSVIRKAPRDLLSGSAQRSTRRRMTANERTAQAQKENNQ
ncbi:site-specific DNA-methyltransferase [Nocardioides sp. OK12]|uniref:site-specific DNA-methyltransferase n=1 Tax=Nocardioides sp. OK12 TaxID=2758661 RepID=UPI0021C43CB8|nr:site-specific DNA-methyltransferase [Nocardioides sp. OK12]GHJ60872.1 site-specific DNA-methyltransferase [Nocardioides sp. OK12]